MQREGATGNMVGTYVSQIPAPKGGHAAMESYGGRIFTPFYVRLHFWGKNILFSGFIFKGYSMLVFYILELSPYCGGV